MNGEEVHLKVAIIGVGNRLMGDDGFGSCLADALMGKVRNAYVTDLGPGNLLGVNLEKYDIIVIIDVGNIEEDYGIYRISPSGRFDISLHDLGLASVVNLYKNKTFYLVACKPERIDIQFGLSKECKSRIRELIPVLIKFLSGLGVQLLGDQEEIVNYIEKGCSET